MNAEGTPGELPGLRDLRRALEILQLEAPVGWLEIRDAYRMHSRRLHPDRNADPGAVAAMAEVNAAYRLLERYVESYQYAFTEEEYLEQNPRLRIDRQFSADQPSRVRKT